MFDRFAIGEQTFATLDDALAYAHSLEVEKLEAAERARQEAEEARQRYREEWQRKQEEEEAKRQRNKPKVIAAWITAGLAVLIASPFVYRWLQEQAEQHRLEETAKLAQVTKDAKAVGIDIMNGATAVNLKEFTSTDKDAQIWCDRTAGTLLTYTVPVPPTNVAKFYNAHLKGGRDKYDGVNVHRTAYRIYDGKRGRQIQLSAFDSGGSSSIYVCDVVPE